jgi:hypothetical protein
MPKGIEGIGRLIHMGAVTDHNRLAVAQSHIAQEAKHGGTPHTPWPHFVGIENLHLHLPLRKGWSSSQQAEQQTYG